MNKQNRTCDAPDAALSHLKSQRNQMIRLHNRLVENARKALCARPKTDFENAKSDLLNALAESEAIIKKHRNKINELVKVQSLYKTLLLQYGILENTNEKLIEQILALDDRVTEKDELEQLVATQKETLSNLRIKLRTIERKYEQSTQNLELLNDENNQLRLMFNEQKNKLSVFFDQHKQMKNDTEQLRKVIRSQEISRVQLINQYEDLRSEYEALYKSSSRMCGA
ncbi:MAG: hypothetical protein AB2551_20035 [Candidatus Thiodiazotropha sp.]